VASRVNRTDLYAQAAAQVGVGLPREPNAGFDADRRALWDGNAPAALRRRLRS